MRRLRDARVLVVMGGLCSGIALGASILAG
jgi:hypothetical protein